MTWWSPLQILGFARGAGFDNHDSKRAATVALVGSGGADHYVYDDPTAPGLASRGLFAVPDALLTEGRGGDQMSPQRSAWAALTLFLEHGCKWDWHPVYAADAGAMVKRTFDALELDGLWAARANKAFATLDLLRNHAYSSPRIVRTLAQYPIDT